MAKRFVYGSFSTIAEVEREVSRLNAKGIPSEAITLVGNEKVLSREDLPYKTIYSTDLENQDTGRKNNFWDTIFGIFGQEEGEPTHTNEKVDIQGYQESLGRQEILIVIDKEYEGQFNKRGSLNQEQTTSPNTKKTVKDREKVKLHEEQLKPGVREDETKSGDVRIHKNVVEDTETVDVPVRNEKVNITHHDAVDETDVDSDAFKEETIDVHVSREEPDVKRETVVRDEVNIEKTDEIDHEKVRGKTREEVIDVEDDRNLTQNDE